MVKMTNTGFIFGFGIGAAGATTVVSTPPFPQFSCYKQTNYYYYCYYYLNYNFCYYDDYYFNYYYYLNYNFCYYNDYYFNYYYYYYYYY
eukprot:gene10632-biopygen2174